MLLFDHDGGAVAGSHPEDWLLGFSFEGRRGLEMPRLHSRLLPSSLPGDSQMILHLFSTHPAQVQSRHLLLKSPLLGHADVHEEDGSLLMTCGHTCCSGR
jgi:hypothetical protein